MRFSSAVLLATLAITPVYAEHIKVSDKCHVINPKPSVDSHDGGGGGLRSAHPYLHWHQHNHLKNLSSFGHLCSPCLRCVCVDLGTS